MLRAWAPPRGWRAAASGARAREAPPPLRTPQAPTQGAQGQAEGRLRPSKQRAAAATGAASRRRLGRPPPSPLPPPRLTWPVSRRWRPALYRVAGPGRAAGRRLRPWRCPQAAAPPLVVSCSLRLTQTLGRTRHQRRQQRRREEGAAREGGGAASPLLTAGQPQCRQAGWGASMVAAPWQTSRRRRLRRGKGRRVSVWGWAASTPTGVRPSGALGRPAISPW